jgi:aminoglycoside phosphotransferase (APT) family kinase protein
VTSETDAGQLAARFAGESVRRADRFPTGLAHFVYDVTLASGARLVVRIGAPGSAPAFAGAAYWSRALRPLGVPLPALLEAGEHAGAPYLILERLPGSDLGAVHAGLSPEQKRGIAGRVAEIQRAVATLPEGRGFGYVLHPDGPFPHASWQGVLRASLQRGRRRIQRAGVFDPGLASQVERALERRAGSLAGVRPRAFLDDTTTKNVIVDAGRLSGIVDVDCVCYGDPLLPVALTRTALLDQGESTEYVDFWCEALGAGAEERAALALYTAAFCIDFMGEVGQRFNRAEAIAADAPRAERLVAMLRSSLAELEQRSA